MRIPKNAVITNISALYYHQLISFKPNKMNIVLPNGTNIKYYNNLNLYSIKTQTTNIINKYQEKIRINNEEANIFSIERLFIELDSFNLEPTLRAEAINNLIKRVDVDKLENVFLDKKINDKRRKITPPTEVINLLEEKKINLLLIIKNKPYQKEEIIQEYLMHRLTTNNQTILIKGGSAISLIVDFKRKTEDVDLHSSFNSVFQLLKVLSQNQDRLYFKFKIQNNKYEDDYSLDADLINKDIMKSKKKIIKLEVKPFSRVKELNVWVQDMSFIVSVNMTYSSQEIKEIFQTFNPGNQKLKLIKNKKARIFSIEMLIAEKYQALIFKPIDTKRAKDLMDLYYLLDEKYNLDLVMKWIVKKSEKQKNVLTREEVFIKISENMAKDLKEIHNSWTSIKSTYDVDINYEDAFNKYLNLSKKILGN